MVHNVAPTPDYAAPDRQMSRHQEKPSGERIQICIGPFEFAAYFEEEAAPRTCAAFGKLLPFKSRIIQARWSGGAGYIPLGDLDLGVPYENNTSHPAPGDILFCPGRLSQTEILIPYDGCMFSSHVGQLSGNHFLTIADARHQLAEFGRRVHWEGAQDVLFDRC
jgi:hypothetical protein